MRFREIQSLHKANDRLRGQTCTAFGTTTGNYLAAVGSCHTGTETVNALTLQDAWLKRSFHGDYLTIRVLDIRELVEKLITKTGAAFYANSVAGSTFIGTRLCRCEIALFGRLRKSTGIPELSVG